MKGPFMPNFVGKKWGHTAFGTPSGIVTWSIVGAGENISRFPVADGQSVAGESFINFDFEQVIRDAVAEWSRYGNIDLVQIEDKGGAAGVGREADIRIFFGDIPTSTVGYGFFPESRVTASAGDILLDTQERYNTDIDFFRGLVLHELGHALGLDHVNDNSVLTPTISSSTLQADDIEGIQGIYGVQDGIAGELYVQGQTFSLLDGPDGLKINGNGRGNTIIGSDADETVDGAGGSDVLFGAGGSDVLVGGAGRDIFHGGAGADTLDGGNGTDTADYSHAATGVGVDFQSPGSGSGEGQGDMLISIERVIGSSGDDTIRADDFKNRIDGQDGDDVLWGRGGNDRLRGADGNDTLNGGEGRDRLDGDAGNDLLQGGAGVDKLRGSFGDDTLEGGDGKDKLRGHEVRDVIDGQGGDDNLAGGLDTDVFIFADGHGNDRVRDFSADELIDLSGVSTLNDFDDVLAASKNTFSGVRITTGDDSSIVLQGVRLNALDVENFIF